MVSCELQRRFQYALRRLGFMDGLHRQIFCHVLFAGSLLGVSHSCALLSCIVVLNLRLGRERDVFLRAGGPGDAAARVRLMGLTGC